MKKEILLITLITFSSYAQVGIGLTNPEPDRLHLGGTTSTIRIESLNAANSADNDGITLSPLFVDKDGNFTLKKSTLVASGAPPLNFLVDKANFIPNKPYPTVNGPDTGTVLNKPIGGTYVTGEIGRSGPITTTQAALIEVKYGVPLVVCGDDLMTAANANVGIEKFLLLNNIENGTAVSIRTYFLIDINSDGLAGAELTNEYGHKGQSYATQAGGTIGYSYMNGQAYFDLPPGTHELIFYGEVETLFPTALMSIGFGGSTDILKIRVYN